MDSEFDEELNIETDDLLLDYYNKGEMVIEVIDSDKKETTENNTITNVNSSQEKVYVYKNNNDTTIFWIIAIGKSSVLFSW